MKRIILGTAALALCFGIGYIITLIIGRRKKLPLLIRVLLSLVFGMIAVMLFFLGYAGVYYSASPDVDYYLQSSNTVEVVKNGDGYFFNGSGEDTLIIFYPGGKVEAESYAPLLYQLSEQGYDCFLVHMPFNLAITDPDKASDIIDDYQYEHIYLMGHSLGGATASMYVSDHPGEIDGLILLAAYPTSPLDDSIRLLSIYGSCDGCLDMDAYDGSVNNRPADSEQLIIEGGNHAQFGYYGEQRGDGEAIISREEQQRITIGKIVAWLSS